MPTPYKVLILGASYGSLLAIKLVAAGHTAKLVCLPAEAEAFNSDLRDHMLLRCSGLAYNMHLSCA